MPVVWADAPGVPQQHHGAVRGHLLLPQLMTVMVTSPKCSLSSSALFAACQTQLCQCAVKMWKNTGALPPPCPCAPQPARASSLQTPPSPNLCARTPVHSLGSSVSPAEPPQCRQLPNLVPGTDLMQGCRDPSSEQTSGSQTAPALPVPSAILGGHVRACLALPRADLILPSLHIPHAATQGSPCQKGSVLISV